MEGIEDKIKDPIEVLVKKYDKGKVLFEKPRRLFGTEISSEVIALNPDQLGYELQEGKNESEIDLDFDLILSKLSRLEARVSGFTDDSFTNMRKAFRAMAQKLMKIKEISENIKS